MRTLLFTFAFLFCVPSYAQQQNKIDSVQALLARDISDPNKLKTQLTLSQLLENQDREKSRNLALEVLNSKSKSLSDSIKSAAYLRLATVAYKQKKDSLALTYLNAIEAIYDVNDSIIPPLIFSKSYRSEISKFTFSMEGVLAAKKYILEGQELAKKSKNESLINFMTYRLGEWHGFFSEAEAPEKHLDTARIYFEKVLPYYKRTGNLEYESKIYYSLASVAVYNKDFKTAEKYYNKRLEAINKTGDSIEIANAYTGLGGYYVRTKQPEKAMVLYDSALTIFSSKGYSDLGKKGELMHKYALVHEQQGDYKAAMNSLFSELVLRDSLYQEENNKGAIEMASKYESEKKQQEITLLKTENALAAQQKKNQRNIMLGGLGLTTAAGIFLFLGFRNRKKTNDKLRELDTAKSNFFANISHEFRTPLSLIAGPIEEQLQKPDLPAREKQNLQTAQRNSQRLVTLVDQLLDLSKLESGHFNLKIQHGDLSTFLKSLASSFEFIAQEKKQNYSAQIDIPESNYWFDADALEKITTNLLSNAIKYSPESATIELNAIVNNGKLNLKVRNSGTRVSKDVLATIFNRFQRADEETAGSGIGLALTKELVELHKGTIRVKNENGWMIFDVILPVHSAAFTEENRYEGIIEAPERKDQMNTTGTTEPTPILEEKDIFSKDINPILLIVDDNEDLRNYVSSLFQEDYTVHTAHNGKAGFTIAQEVVPDLIITDLMMPQEDGLVFTKNCKSSDTTSHIPVLMLTAKAGDENQLEGLETGADAYITKPFNTEILKSTVNNLLESRRKLQERFSQEIILLPKDIATNSIEEKFLENLQAVMDDKLIESDFSTEDFAQSLGMSRMQLHRKLKALTGLSATEFIRSQRLKLAAQLLKKSDINVSQVGYSVGFNNHSYFTKCFKEQYGLAPSEYARTK